MTATKRGDSLLSFESREHPPGLEIVDHIERRRCQLHTPEPVVPTEAPIDEFYFPVDRGVSIVTDRIELAHSATAIVRNHAGWVVGEVNDGESENFPEDLYSVDISGPVKLLAIFESPFSIRVTDAESVLTFETETEVLVGGRSYHEHPAATITTTEKPEDMMTALSYFGSALKTTSCERSFPTLRGHPPLVRLGDETHIPPVLEKPETGVSLELPPDHHPVFTASSLAFYLGATVQPGDEPQIVTDSGFTHKLADPGRGFTGEVARVLKQVFFFDCITRTEGYYPVNLHERNQVEEWVDLDFESLYEKPLSEQLEAYLSIPFATIEHQIPKWKLTAHIQPRVDSIEMIPFVVKDLAEIRLQRPQQLNPSTAPAAQVDEFIRSDDFLRNTTVRTQGNSVRPPELIEIEETESLEQTWIGEGMPFRASKAMIKAYYNRLDREPSEGDIEITVICNDTAMEAEGDIVDEVYGSRDELPFEVNVHRELTANELEGVLQEDIDFLHYIGHIDADGFECIDEKFDAAELRHTGVDAFFLNACSSYQQGIKLIEAGSIGGVVTLQDVINSGAERIGKTLARLMNRGFSLQVALNIAKRRSLMGGHYLVIGDGGLDVVQPESMFPSLVELQKDTESFDLEFVTYATRGLGSISYPFIAGNDEHFLTSGASGNFEVTEAQLNEFLSKETVPVIFENELLWSDEVPW